MNSLEKRIIQISYEQGLSHIGSCLTAVNIIDEIYRQKKSSDKFVLSSGHAHLAHLVVREKYEGYKIGRIHDIHCNTKDGCDISTGSLGQGLPIAVGMALAERDKEVYCLISDGECTEGSIWEALRISDEQKLFNLHVYVNANGYGAYRTLDLELLQARINLFNLRVIFRKTKLPDWQFIADPQEYHYKVLNKQEYEEAIR